MRKLIVFCLFPLLLCGCKEAAVTPVLKNITFVAVGTVDDIQTEFAVQLDDTAAAVTVVKPNTLAGLVFQSGSDGETVSYNGLCTDSFLRRNASASFLLQLLNNVDCEAACLQTDENYTLKVTVNDEKYMFYFSPQGYPLCVKNKNFDTVFTFRGVTLLST